MMKVDFSTICRDADECNEKDGEDPTCKKIHYASKEIAMKAVADAKKEKAAAAKKSKESEDEKWTTKSGEEQWNTNES